MKISLIACPAWAHWAPHPALLLLGAQLRSHSFTVDLYDLNIDSYNTCTEEYKNWWLDQNSYLWESDETFIDFWNEHLSFFEEYANKIAETKPDLVGFCINAGSRFCSPHMARLIRKVLPDTPVIVGGPDCFRSEYFTKHLIPGVVDALCPGEGDLALVQIAKAIEEYGSIPEKMPGFLTWENGEIIDHGDPERPANLDSLAPATLEGITLDKYVHGNRVTISISRGCVKRCAFCSEGPNFFKFRTHSAEWMIDQLSILLVEISKSTLQVPHINFNDSLINGNMKVLEELCDLILEYDMQFTWGGMAIIRKEMSHEFLKKMYRAGCVEICWGIESGSTRILNKMRKNLAISLVDEVLRSTDAAGLQQYGNIIIGFPGEGPFEFAESLFFAAKNIHYFTALGLPIFTPTKNSTVSKIPHKFGMASLDSLNWKDIDETNTPEIRSLRRELLSHIVGTKKFDQGKFGHLEALFRKSHDSGILKDEFFSIANSFYDILKSYIEEIEIETFNYPLCTNTNNLEHEYKELINCLHEFRTFCQNNAKTIPLIPDRIEEKEIRAEIPRGTFHIHEDATDTSSRDTDDLSRQWITVKGVEKETESAEKLQTDIRELDVHIKSPYAQHKIETINSFINFLKGEGMPQTPLELFIEVSNVCNLKCAMCPTFSGLSKHRFLALKAEDRGFFDIDASLEAMEEVLKGTLNIHCFGYGESTIHPEFKQIIEFLSKYDVMLDFFTNGMTLTEEICEILVENKVASIAISFSGTTKEEYENIYLGGNFEQVLSGMRRLADTKELYKSTYPSILINSLGFEHHVQKLDQFIDLMADHGANTVLLKSLQLHDSIPQLAGHKAVMRPWGEEGDVINRAKARASERGLRFSASQFEGHSASSEEEWLEAKNISSTGKSQDSDTIVPLSELKEISKKIEPVRPGSEPMKKNSQTMMDLHHDKLEVLLPVLEADLETKKFPCMEPFKTMYIRKNGNIKPCCFSPDKALPMGSVNTHSLEEIWNGNGYTFLRKGIIKDTVSKLHCNSCIKNKIGPKAHFTHDLIPGYLRWYSEKYSVPLLENNANEIVAQGTNRDIINRHQNNKKETRIINAEILSDTRDENSVINQFLELLNFNIENDLNYSSLIRGNLDAVKDSFVSAWVWSPLFKDLRLSIEIYIDNEKLTSVTANRYRGDLLNAGIGDGHYSIYYQLPNTINDGQRHTVSCKVEGSEYMLSKEPFIIGPLHSGIDQHGA
jgi:anaerobic magnesium-protoporphyrin IX monomethyl ester cyclase